MKEFNKKIDFFLDTGAEVTCIPFKMISENLLSRLQKQDMLVLGPDFSELNIIGILNLNLTYKDKTVKESAYVVKDIKSFILGQPALEQFQMLKRINKIGKKMMDSNSDDQSYTKVNVKAEYPKIFSGLGKFKKTYDIPLKEDAKPFAQPVPINIPIPSYKQVKEEIKKLVEAGILVPVNEPTEWCSPIVCIPKSEGKGIRICGDFTRVNSYIKRSVYPISSVDNSLAHIQGGMYFSKIDVKAGFHQIKLSKKSQRLTTIITPFGRFIYTGLPFGFNISSDIFCYEFDEILAEIPNVIKHVDEVLIFANTIEEHDRILRLVCERVLAAGITLNEEKCVFGVKQIEFTGHIISQKGIDIHPDRVAAIVNFPSPKNVDSVRQFVGIVNFAGKYIPNKSQLLEPLNALLKKDVPFAWTSVQEQAFEACKQILVRAPTLSFYDANKTVIIQADASSFGIGSLLMCEYKSERGIVAYASRTLTETERRYSQIEKEALSLVFACEKFKDYVLGTDFILETDHKPLLQILHTKPIDELTPQLQRIRIRMMRFNYKVVYVPGKLLILADSLSRNPSPREDHFKDDLEKETYKYVRLLMNALPSSPFMLDRIKSEQENNVVCQNLKEYCTKSWPDKNPLLDELFPYYTFKDNLSFNEGFLMYNSRLVIPPNLQLEIIHRIHEGHMGISKCHERAKQFVWWIGLSTQLSHLVTNCPQCVEERINYREEFVKEDFPTRPWQKISIDLFKHQIWYLIVTDYYSRFIEIKKLTSMEEKDIILILKDIFGRFGIPEIARSDNGPQFRSEYIKFAKQYEFKIEFSSPKFHQSNGCIEAAVKIAKALIKKSKDINLSLLSYRTTPLENGFSPAELMFSRKIRSTLPVVPSQLDSFHSHAVVLKKEKKRKERQERQYNKIHRSNKLSPLKEGDKVWIIDLRVYKDVVAIDKAPNSYWVQTDKSRVRRNRFSLVPAPYRSVPLVNDEINPVLMPIQNQNVNNNNERGMDEQRVLNENNCRDNANENNVIQNENNVIIQNEQINQKPVRQRNPPGWMKDYVRK